MYITTDLKQYDKETDTHIWSGSLNASGATFTAETSGSGNSATFKINIQGGQFDMGREAFYISVVGEWEMMELLEIMKLITPKN